MKYVDSIELAAFIVDVDVEDFYGAMDEIELKIISEYGMDLEQFNRLTNKLLDLIVVSRSPLTGSLLQGFGKNGYYLMRKSAEETK